MDPACGENAQPSLGQPGAPLEGGAGCASFCPGAEQTDWGDRGVTQACHLPRGPAAAQISPCPCVASWGPETRLPTDVTVWTFKLAGRQCNHPLRLHLSRIHCPARDLPAERQRLQPRPGRPVLPAVPPDRQRSVRLESLLPAWPQSPAPRGRLAARPGTSGRLLSADLTGPSGDTRLAESHVVWQSASLRGLGEARRHLSWTRIRELRAQPPLPKAQTPASQTRRPPPCHGVTQTCPQRSGNVGANSITLTCLQRAHLWEPVPTMPRRPNLYRLLLREKPRKWSRGSQGRLSQAAAERPTRTKPSLCLGGGEKQ